MLTDGAIKVGHRLRRTAFLVATCVCLLVAAGEQARASTSCAAWNSIAAVSVPAGVGQTQFGSVGGGGTSFAAGDVTGMRDGSFWDYDKGIVLRSPEQRVVAC